MDVRYAHGWSGVVLAVLAVAPACGSKSLSGAQIKQVEDCAQTVAEVYNVQPSDRSMVLADGCPAATPHIAEILHRDPSQRRQLIDTKTDFTCAKALDKGVAGMAPDARRKAMVAICGRDYYGLPAGKQWMLSLDWWMAQRVGAYLAATRKKLDKPLRDKVDAAMAKGRLALPVPAVLDGVYELPVATQLERSPFPSVYVVVTASQLRVAPALNVTFAPAGITVTGEADAFPGVAIYPADLAGRARELGWTPPPGGDSKPKSHRGTNAFVTADTPMILADTAAPAWRIARVVKTLGEPGIRLGVRTRRSPSVLALKLRLRWGGGNTSVPLVLEATPTELLIAGRAPGKGVMREKWDELPEVLAKARGFVTTPELFISVRDGVAARQLVDVLDAAALAGFITVALTDTTAEQLDASRLVGDTGLGGSPVGSPKMGAAVGLTRLTSVGTLDRNIIRRYVRRKRAPVRRCYEAQLMKTPTLHGDLVAAFTIAPTGRVIESKVRGLNKEMSNCVANVFRSIQFPRPSGNNKVNVTAHLTFTRRPK